MSERSVWNYSGEIWTNVRKTNSKQAGGPMEQVRQRAKGQEVRTDEQEVVCCNSSQNCFILGGGGAHVQTPAE